VFSITAAFDDPGYCFRAFTRWEDHMRKLALIGFAFALTMLASATLIKAEYAVAGNRDIVGVNTFDLTTGTINLALAE
jgi:hypothetical protein